MDLKHELEKNDVLLLLFPESTYAEQTLEITKSIANQYKNILYITLNKPYHTISKMLKDNQIKTEKFFFMDAISKTVKEPEPTENCDFISSPNNLTEISLHLSTICEEMKPNSIIFDSLSTLLIYEKGESLIKFVHSLVAKIRMYNSKSVLMALAEDLEKPLIQDLNMFVDKVINLSELEKKGGR